MTQIAKSPFSEINSNLQLAWDSTSLGEFKTCPRKYYYRIIRGLAPLDISAHLVFGLAYHAALEAFDRALTKGSDYDAAVLIAARAALDATWDNDLDRPWVSEEKTKTRDTLLRTVIWYLDFFKDESMKTVVFSDNRPAVEISFRFDSGLKAKLTGENYIFCGHLDKVVSFLGRKYIVDRKTSKSELNDSYVAHYTPDNQVSLYAIAGGIVLDQPVAGILIDAVQVQVNGSRFHRFQVDRNKQQLEEWLNDAEFWLNQAEQCAKDDYWPMQDKACGNFERVKPLSEDSFGGYSGGCPYREICSTCGVTRDAVIRTGFKIEPWNPLDVRGE
jgi:hypothetical protein